MAPKNSFFGEVSAIQSLKSPAAAYCPPEVAPKNSFYGAVSAAHSQNYLGGPLHRLHLGGAKRGAARQRWPRRIPLFGAVSAIHSLMAPGRSPTPPTTEKALAASQRWPRRSSRGSSFFGAVSATHSLKITWAVLYTADISGTETWRGETRRRPPRVGRSCLHVLARHPFGAVWANHSLAVTWAVLCTAPCQRWPQKIATTKHVMT